MSNAHLRHIMADKKGAKVRIPSVKPVGLGFPAEVMLDPPLKKKTQASINNSSYFSLE